MLTKIQIISILFLGVVLFLIFQSNFFDIKKVDVFVTNRLDCANQTQLKDSSSLAGKNIFFISNQTLTRIIKDKFFCVKNLTLTKHFPDKIEINISGREGVAYLIATPSASETPTAFLIDNEGMIFSKDINNLNIPKIFANISKISLGQRLEKISEIQIILDKIKTYGLDTQTSEVVDQSLVILTNPKVIFNLEDKVEEQLASLQLILNKAKINRWTVPTDVGINADQLEFIDLRFDKPVIRIAPKKNG